MMSSVRSSNIETQSNNDGSTDLFQGVDNYMALGRSMIARNGRERERRNEKTGARLAAAVVALSTPQSHPEEGDDATNKYVLLVSSSKGLKAGQWVLPKGGWESDESLAQCALREGWEEGGVIGSIDGFLGHWEDPRPIQTSERISKYIKNQLCAGMEEANKNIETSKQVNVLCDHVDNSSFCGDSEVTINGIQESTSSSSSVGSVLSLDGATGKLDQDMRKLIQTIPPRAEYQYFQVKCKALAKKFPEMHKRQRKWATFEEAKAALVNRAEMIKALEASSIKRNTKN